MQNIVSAKNIVVGIVIATLLAVVAITASHSVHTARSSWGKVARSSWGAVVADADDGDSDAGDAARSSWGRSSWG